MRCVLPLHNCFGYMNATHKICALALLLALAFSQPACWLKDKTEKCRDQLVGDWISTDFKGPYTDEAAIYLRLDDDNTGKITFEYDNGEQDAFDIDLWKINEDCNRFEFTDEDEDEADFEVLQLDGDALELKGDLYDDPYTLRFRRR